MKKTITYKGISLDVEFSYQKAEPRTQFHQGCEAGVDVISKIIHKDEDLYDIISQSDINEITECVNKQL